MLEDALDWIRYLSSQAGARALSAKDFAAEEAVRATAKALPDALKRAEGAIADLADAYSMQQDMALLARSFDDLNGTESLFEAVLARHHEVQQGKAPDGKRDWFERNPDGATFVRVPYRLTKAPAPKRGWNRPYRFDTVRSFLDDLKVGIHELA